MLNLFASQPLLARARTLYDDPGLPYQEITRTVGWKTGFESGAEWMRLVMAEVRGAEVPPVRAPFQLIGISKYALCALGALAYAGLVIASGLWPLLVGVVIIFYGIEAQMVFLFPILLDGSPAPFREARRWTVRAGGTLRVMMAVLALAVVMLFGSLFRQGALRCWALGCLSVVLWYEDLRRGGMAFAYVPA